MTTIVSIDTGDPRVPESTTALVKICFTQDGGILKDVYTYTGSYSDKTVPILEFIGEVDQIVIEKIDATNKFISRSVVEEQLALQSFLKSVYGDGVQELIRSGRREIITDLLLKKVDLFYENDRKTHHHDVREATRNLLYFMAKIKELNAILSNYVQRFFK